VWRIGVLLLALGAAAVPAAAQDDETDLFWSGQNLERQGDWEGALALWATAPDSSIGTGRSDPRIGPAFISTALAHDAQDRLEEASRLYLWGFSGREVEAHREEVLLEARRIVPLLTQRDSARWQPLLEGETGPLARRIARFWLEHDPTPESVLNERLVEHWKRIVEARDRYRYNLSSAYETDDRGIVFVKYGPPGTRSRGHLGASEMELKIRVEDSRARMIMRRYDPNPQYELWKYGGLNPEEFTFYLFGNVGGTGPFELVEGPLDLISPTARSLSSANKSPGGVRIQYYLELFYYRDLSILGGRYGRRFDELAQLWDSYTLRRNAFGAGMRPSPTAPTLQTFSYRFEEEDRYAPEGVPTIEVRSDFEGAARSVEMVVQVVRVLDPSEPADAGHSGTLRTPAAIARWQTGGVRVASPGHGPHPDSQKPGDGRSGPHHPAGAGEGRRHLGLPSAAPTAAHAGDGLREGGRSSNQRRGHFDARWAGPRVRRGAPDDRSGRLRDQRSRGRHARRRERPGAGTTLPTSARRAHLDRRRAARLS